MHNACSLGFLFLIYVFTLKLNLSEEKKRGKGIRQALKEYHPTDSLLFSSRDKTPTNTKFGNVVVYIRRDQ